MLRSSLFSYTFIRLQAYHKIYSEHCQNRDPRLIRSDGHPSSSSQESQTSKLAQNLARYGAEYYEDEKGEDSSSDTGSSFGEGFCVDDEDSVMHDVSEDPESSKGGENA